MGRGLNIGYNFSTVGLKRELRTMVLFMPGLLLLAFTCGACPLGAQKKNLIGARLGGAVLAFRRSV